MLHYQHLTETITECVTLGDHATNVLSSRLNGEL